MHAYGSSDRHAVLTLLQVPERLAGWASSIAELTAWLARFSSLRRPLDGAMPLAEVLMAAGDVASGILTAKAAAQAARAASEAAEQARASAEKVGAMGGPPSSRSGTPTHHTISKLYMVKQLGVALQGRLLAQLYRQGANIICCSSVDCTDLLEPAIHLHILVRLLALQLMSITCTLC